MVFLIYLTIVVIFNVWQWMDTRSQLAYCRDEIENTRRFLSNLEYQQDKMLEHIRALSNLPTDEEIRNIYNRTMKMKEEKE